MRALRSVEHFEVVIIGGGIAGASLAYFLAELGCADVLVLEREELPGTQSTGRSAAVLVVPDPNSAVQRLKARGRAFLHHPPGGFCDNPILHPTGILVLVEGRPEVGDLERQGVAFELLSPAQARQLVEPIDSSTFDEAILLPGDGALDVHELLTGYLRGARRGGAEIRCKAEALGLIVESGRCVGVETAQGAIRSRWVVDAAGAWAGRMGAAAGGSRIRITPRRRCAITYAPPAGLETGSWPFVKSEVHSVYVKHEAGDLLMSPMDEEPVEPCEPAPDEQAIARGVERLRALAPGLVPRAVRSRWAGLRSFTPDGAPVMGEDPALPGLFWLAGQGGAGIVTSPILGRAAAELIASGRTDSLDARALSPARLL